MTQLEKTLINFNEKLSDKAFKTYQRKLKIINNKYIKDKNFINDNIDLIKHLESQFSEIKISRCGNYKIINLHLKIIKFNSTSLCIVGQSIHKITNDYKYHYFKINGDKTHYSDDCEIDVNLNFNK